MANTKNKGRKDEARDPDRPTTTNEETGETEKVGLGPRTERAEQNNLVNEEPDDTLVREGQPLGMPEAIYHRDDADGDES